MARMDRIEVFKEKVIDPTDWNPKIQWRWRYVRSNGSIIAGPQEGYVKRVHAIRMAKHVTNWAQRPAMRIIDVETGEDVSGVHPEARRSKRKQQQLF